MRKHLLTFLKVGITLAGLAYVLTRVPLDKISAELASIRWPWLFLSFLLIGLGVMIRAYRWQLLLRGLGVSVRFKRLVALYFIGNFFNAFLPSGFGGDVVRVLEVARDVPGAVATGTVIVDRLTGLLMLFLMALLALPFRPESFPTDLLLLITALSVAGLLAGFLLLEGKLIRRLGSWLPGVLSLTDEKQPLAKLLLAVQGCGWRAVAGALAVSGLFNLLLVGWWAAAGHALGYEISYSYYILVVPILSVALVVPSVGGLGVRETLAPILFASAALMPEQATALAFLVFVLLRLLGLSGAPVYLVSVLRGGRKERGKSAETAESA